MEHPAFFPDIERDGIGSTHRSSIQVYVVGDQKVAGPNDRGAPLGIEAGGTKIRLPIGLLQFFRQSLVLSRADGSQVAALRATGGSFVQEDRQIQLTAHAFPQATCPGNGLFHGDVGNRDKGTYVGRAHARVLAAMLAHVNNFAGFSDGQKGSFYHGFRSAHEGNHGAVGRFAGINVQQFDAFYAFDHCGDLPDHCGITSFGEVGDAFDKLLHEVKS